MISRSPKSGKNDLRPWSRGGTGSPTNFKSSLTDKKGKNNEITLRISSAPIAGQCHNESAVTSVASRAALPTWGKRSKNRGLERRVEQHLVRRVEDETNDILDTLQHTRRCAPVTTSTSEILLKGFHTVNTDATPTPTELPSAASSALTDTAQTSRAITCPASTPGLLSSSPSLVRMSPSPLGARPFGTRVEARAGSTVVKIKRVSSREGMAFISRSRIGDQVDLGDGAVFRSSRQRPRVFRKHQPINKSVRSQMVASNEDLDRDRDEYLLAIGTRKFRTPSSGRRSPQLSHREVRTGEAGPTSKEKSRFKSRRKQLGSSLSRMARRTKMGSSISRMTRRKKLGSSLSRMDHKYADVSQAPATLAISPCSSFHDVRAARGRPYGDEVSRGREDVGHRINADVAHEREISRQPESNPNCRLLRDGAPWRNEPERAPHKDRVVHRYDQIVDGKRYDEDDSGGSQASAKAQCIQDDETHENHSPTSAHKDRDPAQVTADREQVTADRDPAQVTAELEDGLVDAMTALGMGNSFESFSDGHEETILGRTTSKGILVVTERDLPE